MNDNNGQTVHLITK